MLLSHRRTGSEALDAWLETHALVCSRHRLHVVCNRNVVSEDALRTAFARIGAYGKTRTLERGDVSLVEAKGAIVMRPGRDGEPYRAVALEWEPGSIGVRPNGCVGERGVQRNAGFDVPELHPDDGELPAVELRERMSPVVGTTTRPARRSSIRCRARATASEGPVTRRALGASAPHRAGCPVGGASMRVASLGMIAFAVSIAACGGSRSDGGTVDGGTQQDSSAADDSTSAPTDSGVDAARETSPPTDGTTDSVPSDVSTACIDDVTAGHHRYTCDGFVYDVEIPDACTAAGACGLVIDVHGFTMDANMEDANTNMRALGHTYGYVVVQPNANPKPPAASWNPPGDDDKVFAFIQAAIVALKVDTKKVHFTGFSQGGMMTFRMLCKHADAFASVAPAAGTGCSFTSGDTPSREIPVLYMHGVSDALVSFDSTAVPQRDAVVKGWSMDAGTVIATDGHYTRTRYTSPSGNVFEFLQHDYEASTAILRGHCYPGSTDPAKEPGQLFPFNCVPPNAFVWGEEAMKFFVAHPGK